jgi:type II secretory pathway pseudopilin PulG
MQILIMLGIVLTAVMVTYSYRRSRDREMLGARVAALGGTAPRVKRAGKREHPFPDTGRGWWAWRIDWRDAAGERRSWALTDREGIKEWRD